MPLYEYQCEACGHRFEKIQKFSDSPVEVCPNCGEKKVQKLVSSPAIQFKGTGWYITDYAKKGTVGTESSKDKDKADKAADTKSSDEKSSSSSTTKDDKPAAAAPPATSSSKDS